MLVKCGGVKVLESNIFPNCKWYDVVYCGCWFNIRRRGVELE
nr:MAG TPA: hypothetical protein [Caudoviricetes sp.]